MTTKPFSAKMIVLYGVAALAIILPLTNYWWAEILVEEEREKIWQGIDINIVFVIIGLVISSIMTGVGLSYTAKENRQSRKERNLSLVGTFSGQLTALKDKERNLKSQKDCETYAQNYVDLMDQIAYLYLKGNLPDEIADFFENEFSYGLTMIEWMNQNNIENYLTEVKKADKIIRKNDESFFKYITKEDEKCLEDNKEITLTRIFPIIDDKKELRGKSLLTVDKLIFSDLEARNPQREKETKIRHKAKKTFEDEYSKEWRIKEIIGKQKTNVFSIDKQYPWTSLLERSVSKRIYPFDEDQQLPQTMKDYDKLPSDERDKIMEVINEYSSQISELKSQERSLSTKNDCETYAANFVDEMDQIAFLYEKNSFPSDTNEYFVNDFEYALTMISWLENNGAACELRKDLIKEDQKYADSKTKWKDLKKQYDANLKLIEDEDDKFKKMNDKLTVKNNLKKSKEDDIENNIELVKEIETIDAEIAKLKNDDSEFKEKKDLKKSIEDKLKEKPQNIELVKEIIQIEDEIADQKKIISEFKENRKRAFTWDSLMSWTEEQELEPLDVSTLPIPMQEYYQLPDEEIDNTLDLIKEYGEKIAQLTLKEQDLDKWENSDVGLTCELYANSYIDLLDGVAFLHHTKALPEKVATYFENNFCYALTLVKYLVDTDDAEQKILPAAISIEDKQLQFAEITCEKWLGDKLPIQWIIDNISKINDGWLNKKLREGKITKNDLKEWAIKNNTELKEEIEKINEFKEIDSQKIDFEKINGWEDLQKRIQGNFIEKSKENLEKITKNKGKSTWDDLRKILTVGNEYTWTDLMMWCRENNLTRYKIRQLPPIMRVRILKKCLLKKEYLENKIIGKKDLKKSKPESEVKEIENEIESFEEELLELKEGFEKIPDDFSHRIKDYGAKGTFEKDLKIIKEIEIKKEE